MTPAVPWIAVVLGAIAFGALGAIAIAISARVCRGLSPFSDGPRPGSPPVRALVLGAALVGGVLVAQNGFDLSLAGSAILIFALVASWYADVRCGIIPDRFTVVPAVLVFMLALAERDWMRLAFAAIVTALFAGAALASKGIGMGWGDVKLVGLGAIALGDRSILAFAAACFVAVAVAAIRHRRSEPIAFAPYLAGATALASIAPFVPRLVT